jgi:hypothetical protein
MGMDIYGIRPTSKRGEYYRNGRWSWEHLATLVTTLCSKESARCKNWFTNDGDGLIGVGACDLADALQDKINQGAVRSYIKIRNAELKAIPNDSCDLCEGTGVVQRDAKDQTTKKFPTDAEWSGDKHPPAGQVGWGEDCDGRGFNRPEETLYPIKTKDVREFIAFLRDSGGFEIC